MSASKPQTARGDRRIRVSTGSPDSRRQVWRVLPAGSVSPIAKPASTPDARHRRDGRRWKCRNGNARNGQRMGRDVMRAAQSSRTGCRRAGIPRQAAPIRPYTAAEAPTTKASGPTAKRRPIPGAATRHSPGQQRRAHEALEAPAQQVQDQHVEQEMPQIGVQERAGDDPPPLPELGDVGAGSAVTVEHREPQRVAGEGQDARQLVGPEEDHN